MAVQVESRGQLQEFLEMLGRRKWQVILPAAILITIGSAFAVLVPKKYVVKTQVELRPVSVSVSSKEGTNASFQIRSTSRIRKVIQMLSGLEQGARYLAMTPEEQTDFVDDAKEDIKVTTAKDTSRDTAANFVDITYSHVDKTWGVQFLKTLRQDWIDDVVERDLNKVQDEEKRIQEQVAKLQKELEQEERHLTELKTLHGISATQPIPGAEGVRGEDPVYARLQRNRELHDDKQLERVNLEVEIAELEKQHRDLPQNLTSEQLVAGSTNADALAQLELEYLAVQEELARFLPASTFYQKAYKKSRALEDRREQLQRLITKGEVQTTATPNPARAELRAKIDEKKLEAAVVASTLAKLAADIQRDEEDSRKLQDVYSEIRERSATIKRLEEARTVAYLAYEDKVKQGKLLASPLSIPFEITQDVQAGEHATEPNMWLIVAFSVIAGLALGLAVAVIAEYSRNCFRNVGDISRVMVVPVLGTIDTIVTRREARLAAARRAIVGCASLAFILAVVFVTWASVESPDLLSSGVQDKLRAFRTFFS